eukprot:1162074-Pelagomonas_calceolata.AAC.14
MPFAPDSVDTIQGRSEPKGNTSGTMLIFVTLFQFQLHPVVTPTLFRSQIRLLITPGTLGSRCGSGSPVGERVTASHG